MTTDAVTDLRDELRALLPPGTTVYVVRRRESRSGRTAQISLYAVRDGALDDITRRVAAVQGYPCNPFGCIVTRQSAGEVVQRLTERLHDSIAGLTAKEL